MVGKYLPSAYVKAGPKSFKDQMSKEEWNKYQEQLDWIQAQKAAGKLPRGWQSIASDQVGYTMVTISEVLNRKRCSPPCLDKLYVVALGMVGENSPQDKADRVKTQQKVVDLLSARVDELDAELAQSSLDFEALVAQMQAQHQADLELIQRKRKEAEKVYGQAYGRLEQYLLEYDLEGESYS